MTLSRSALLTSLLALSLSAQAEDAALRINQIQLIGSHNSYHAGFQPSGAMLMQKFAPDTFAGLNYSHPSLTAQLDAGVRQFELDVYADSKGGLYAHPALTQLLAKAGLPADPPMVNAGVMDRPGFKVMHVQDIDQRSVCQPFTACLAELRAWSKAHPYHIPLFILVETKADLLEVPKDAPIPFETVKPEPFTTAVLDALDQEIASVFPRQEIITPDDVRGKHATLPEAIARGGWPTLAAARGKVIFLLDQQGVTADYLKGHPALRDRVLFTHAKPGAADAAFVECNGCEAPAINALADKGYLVRTRSDDPESHLGLDARSRRRDAVLSSGAQIVSTDHPAGEAAPDGFVVGLPGGAVARCNPVTSTPACNAGQLK